MKKATLGRDALSLLILLAVFPQWFSRDAAMEVGRTEVTKNWSPLGWEMVLDLLVRNGFIIANKCCSISLVVSAQRRLKVLSFIRLPLLSILSDYVKSATA